MINPGLRILGSTDHMASQEYLWWKLFWKPFPLVWPQTCSLPLLTFLGAYIYSKIPSTCFPSCLGLCSGVLINALHVFSRQLPTTRYTSLGLIRCYHFRRWYMLVSSIQSSRASLTRWDFLEVNICHCVHRWGLVVTSDDNPPSRCFRPSSPVVSFTPSLSFIH